MIIGARTANVAGESSAADAAGDGGGTSIDLCVDAAARFCHFTFPQKRLQALASVNRTCQGDVRHPVAIADLEETLNARRTFRFRWTWNATRVDKRGEGTCFCALRCVLTMRFHAERRMVGMDPA